jgi:hypothetical protein
VTLPVAPEPRVVPVTMPVVAPPAAPEPRTVPVLPPAAAPAPPGDRVRIATDVYLDIVVDEPPPA